ncbi:MAG: hypothetical protein WC164_01905 [Patescibacteria group bacterium]
MKNVRLKLFLLLLICFFPFIAKASSGACSGHGGINCSAGADYDGSVICNDGWRDSSVKYYDADECASKYIYIDDIDQYNKIINDIQISCDSNSNQIKSSYQQQIEEIEKEYLNLENSLKSRLIKLGVNPSDSSWSNAINGNNQRLNDAKQVIISEMNLYLNEEETNCSKKKSVYIYDEDLYNRICISKLGQYSKFNKETKECDCVDGYNLGYDWTFLTCIKKTDCNDGYVLSEGKCISHTENCKIFFGDNVYGIKDVNNVGGSSCYCNQGYKWSDDKKHCILSQVATDNKLQIDLLTKNNEVDIFIKREKEFIEKVDFELSKRMGGKILLQVESSGEGWYVNPENNKRYFLGRPADAFDVMRELGLGVSNKDFDSFKGLAPKRLSGRILLKVEDSGKAYYVNPVNLKMHFLGRPSDAFDVMRDLGLGISNNDIRKIDIN